MSTEFRHEYKYVLDMQQSRILEMRVRNLIPHDRNATKDGMYAIHSLYFDDYQDSCFYENEAGVNVRSKYRIRYYNNDCSYISLEKKSKVNGMTKKESCRITEEQCRQFMMGKIPEIHTSMSEKMQKLFSEMRCKNMIPKVIVHYDRAPYVYEIGNVRITFDRNIESSNDFVHFLDGTKVNRPILAVGESIMEVKWDEILPEFIEKGIALNELQWSSFSKYYLCRKYNCYGGIKI